MSITNGSKSDFQRAIMEKGFYSENLPPVFSVEQFYDAAKSLGLFNDDQIEPRKPLALARYNETKRGGQRRIFSFPNPLFFVDVSTYLGSHRTRLNRALRRSKISRSIPNFDTEFGRAIKIDSFSEFTSCRRQKLSTSRYIVKTDISRFFPSIYTHSIPWAVHGKKQSKQDRSPKSSQTYANKLDYLIRQAQDQQTIGIPVGPDSSRIVSELIAGAIDEEFVGQVGPDVVGARLVDDVYLGASSQEEAEKLLSAYRDSIRKFELDINESKTRIFESRQDLEPFWPVSVRRELERFQEGPVNRLSKSDLTIYLDEIIRLANAEGDDGIIKYSIRKMDDFGLWMQFWDCIEPYLFRVSVNFPHCLDYVARVIAWRHRTATVDERRWQEVCRAIIDYHAPQGNDSEVVWACWIIKEISGKIPAISCESIIKRCGPLAVLLSLDIEAGGNVTGRFPKNLIYGRLDSSPMLGNDWLLSYEAERSFGYRLKGKNRNDYSVFGDLIDFGTQFYNSSARPFVFQGVDDFDEVTEALEDRIGLYEDDDFDDDDDIDDIF